MCRARPPKFTSADRRRTRRARSAARRRTSSTSARVAIFDLIEDNRFSRSTTPGPDPIRLRLSLAEPKLVFAVARAGRRAGGHPHPVADAVPADRQGLLHDLRELLRGDPHRDAEPDRGDRHGPARPPRRRSQTLLSTGSPARSRSISRPRGGCSRWSARCTGGARRVLEALKEAENCGSADIKRFTKRGQSYRFRAFRTGAGMQIRPR